MLVAQESALNKVAAAAATALVAIQQLPRSLNPLIRPLMHTLKVRDTIIDTHTKRESSICVIIDGGVRALAAACGHVIGAAAAAAECTRPPGLR